MRQTSDEAKKRISSKRKLLKSLLTKQINQVSSFRHFYKKQCDDANDDAKSIVVDTPKIE